MAKGKKEARMWSEWRGEGELAVGPEEASSRQILLEIESLQALAGPPGSADYGVRRGTSVPC